jgi:hypothetical protein
LPILPPLGFTLRVLGDEPLTPPVSLLMHSLGSSLINPLDRPLFPELRYYSPSLPGTGLGLGYWRGPVGSTLLGDPPFGVRPFFTPVIPRDVTQLILDGLDQTVDGVNVKIWINQPPPQGNRPKPADGDYDQVTDPDTRKGIIDILNQAAGPANKPKVDSNSEVQIQTTVVSGVQAVAHRKVAPADPKTATSTEVQAVQGQTVTFQFHRDDDSGAEIAVTVNQYAKDLAFHDPSQTGAAAAQKPVSTQGNLSLNYVQVLNKKLSVNYGVSGFIGRSSQFDDTHRLGTDQFGLSSSIGLQYKANDWLTLGAGIGPGVTFGPGTGRDWSKVNWGDDTTIDFTGQGTLSIDQDKVIDALIKAFKK